MSAEGLIAKLTGVQGHGPRWRAICPAHESKHRSRTLVVQELPDGRVLIKCFAGCEVYSIVSAVGLELADLFPPKPAFFDDTKRPARVRKPWTPGEVAAALRVPLTEAFMLLRKTGSGARLTLEDLERCLVTADVCADLLDELNDPGRG